MQLCIFRIAYTYIYTIYQIILLSMDRSNLAKWKVLLRQCCAKISTVPCLIYTRFLIHAMLSMAHQLALFRMQFDIGITKKTKSIKSWNKHFHFVWILIESMEIAVLLLLRVIDIVDGDGEYIWLFGNSCQCATF